jgi:hypothetical protein
VGSGYATASETQFVRRESRTRQLRRSGAETMKSTTNIACTHLTDPGPFNTEVTPVLNWLQTNALGLEFSILPFLSSREASEGYLTERRNRSLTEV